MVLEDLPFNDLVCYHCNQSFKTQENVDHHFWCFTPEELKLVIRTAKSELKETE